MIRNKDSIQGNDNKKYDDIINLGRPVSGRQRMSMSDRAAQFASFAALTGYEDAVKETACRHKQRSHHSRCICVNILPDFRSRTNKAHIPFKDIDKLRQFIKP